jgi:hypothetical protein
VRFLRRQPATSDDAGADSTSAEAEVGHAPGKGRPTPKRRDAEGRRRGPAPPPPRTQRESMKLAKQNRGNREQRRKAAAERRTKMNSGDDKSLPKRDRGPDKGYIRDLVDSRRHLLGLFMPLAGFVFVSLLVPFPQAQQVLSVFSMSMMAAMVIEGVLLGHQITKKVRERFPDKDVKGLSTGWYSFTRASQLRRLRTPKPRVSYGYKV